MTLILWNASIACQALKKTHANNPRRNPETNEFRRQGPRKANRDCLHNPPYLKFNTTLGYLQLASVAFRKTFPSSASSFLRSCCPISMASVTIAAETKSMKALGPVTLCSTFRAQMASSRSPLKVKVCMSTSTAGRRRKIFNKDVDKLSQRCRAKLKFRIALEKPKPASRWASWNKAEYFIECLGKQGFIWFYIFGKTANNIPHISTDTCRYKNYTWILPI